MGKGFEKSLELLRLHSRAPIGDFDFDSAFLSTQHHLHPGRKLPVLNGIAHHVFKSPVQ